MSQRFFDQEKLERMIRFQRGEVRVMTEEWVNLTQMETINQRVGLPSPKGEGMESNSFLPNGVLGL